MTNQAVNEFGDIKVGLLAAHGLKWPSSSPFTACTGLVISQTMIGSQWALTCQDPAVHFVPRTLRLSLLQTGNSQLRMLHTSGWLPARLACQTSPDRSAASHTSTLSLSGWSGACPRAHCLPLTPPGQTPARSCDVMRCHVILQLHHMYTDFLHVNGWQRYLNL